ncbi:MAG: hypothetical protein K8S98_18690 [Planctomycetes bacterium]|nr:hypothetical protein [Planctomycetota bacterium]
MRFLASVQVRLFLVCWILFSLFFATNVVREHYPAFALLDRGDFKCDRYAHMHADLFQHTDGHWYVGNNLLGSMPVVVVLAIFDPLLDRLEEHSKAKLAASPDEAEVQYDTKYPNRQKMWKLVKSAGLDLRFGASTAITSVFLMAPLSALFAVLVFRVLQRRGVERGRAVWLGLLFAFGTPVFYRTAHLNHNMFLMEAIFAAFVIVWLKSDERRELATKHRVLFGALLGATCALDYAGFVLAGVVFLYFFVPRLSFAGFARTVRESIPIALAGVPFIAFLLWTQWLMYGDPFTPGQKVMPQQNEYVDFGYRGIGLPSLEVFVKNLIAPGWGLYAFGPLLLIALVPAALRVKREELFFPTRERRWALALVIAFMLFCAANWYSLLQFNTGFRYLLPCVPFLFLAASDHLARMKTTTLALVSVLVIAHGTVLAMTREVNDVENTLRHEAVERGVSELALPDYWRRMLTETPVPVAYRRIAQDGAQLPWLTVARQTQPALKEKLASPWLPLGLLAFAIGTCLAIWRYGASLNSAAFAGPTLGGTATKPLPRKRPS